MKTRPRRAVRIEPGRPCVCCGLRESIARAQRGDGTWSPVCIKCLALIRSKVLRLPLPGEELWGSSTTSSD